VFDAVFLIFGFRPCKSLHNTFILWKTTNLENKVNIQNRKQLLFIFHVLKNKRSMKCNTSFHRWSIPFVVPSTTLLIFCNYYWKLKQKIHFKPNTTLHLELFWTFPFFLNLLLPILCLCSCICMAFLSSVLLHKLVLVFAPYHIFVSYGYASPIVHVHVRICFEACLLFETMVRNHSRLTFLWLAKLLSLEMLTRSC